MIQINTLDKGIYYVGDPTKLLPSSIYTGIWGEAKYMPGLYVAHGYQFLTYQTFHDENTIIYTDNIDRKYKIESNTICIAPKEIVFENIAEEDAVILTVENKLSVYQNKKNLYFNIDDNIFYIDIGKEEIFNEDDSDNESTNSLNEYIKKVSMEEYDNEFNIHYSSDEEDNFNPNDIVADDILDKKQNIDDDEDNYHEDEDHYHEDEDYEQEQEEDYEQEEEENKPKTVFFKQKR
jgi:hypothetical protein